MKEYRNMKEYRSHNGYPPTICIELTNKCNLSCPYCRADASPLKGDRLSVESITSLLSELKHYGEFRVSITGGEPLLYKHLPELIVHINRLKFPYCITTNGTIPIDRLLSLAPSVFRDGTIKISIDGSESVHDSFRGLGNFARSMSFIRDARSLFERLIVNTVLIANPVEWAEELQPILAETQLHRWTIISPTRLGAWDNSLPDPSACQYATWFEYVNRLNANAKSPISISYFDYALRSLTVQDIVSLKSNYTILYPGKKGGHGTQARSDVLCDPTVAASNIVSSIERFIDEHGYIQ
jgi:sulfatase maturation enzyme AslB (radical SAM superfamily)